MTICVAIKVYDCIVFAADSALSISHFANPNEISLVYQHGNKVFNLYKGLPICAMFCGMGNFGSMSVSSLAKDLRWELSRAVEDGGINPTAYTIEEVVGRTRAFSRSDTTSFRSNRTRITVSSSGLAAIRLGSLMARYGKL